MLLIRNKWEKSNNNKLIISSQVLKLIDKKILGYKEDLLSKKLLIRMKIKKYRK